MMPACVALTTLTDRIRMDELACVAAALQIQVMRDFAPEWSVGAMIAAVPFEAIPAGYCPIIIQETRNTEGAYGFHRTQSDDMPYILLPYGPSWSLAASHTLLRMLADPTGSARRPGPSLLHGQGIVEYLVDVCAPCQDMISAYAIDGIAVSDFCTPRFFSDPSALGAVRSFAGSVGEAFRPAANGLVTWLADDGLLYQAQADQAGRIRIRGGFSAANRGVLTMRELIDMLTPHRLERLSHAPRTASLDDAWHNARRARMANLARYRDDIAWRFGDAMQAAAPRAAEPMHRVTIVKSQGGAPIPYASGIARSRQSSESEEVHTARPDP